MSQDKYSDDDMKKLKEKTAFVITTVGIMSSSLPDDISVTKSFEQLLLKLAEFCEAMAKYTKRQMIDDKDKH